MNLIEKSLEIALQAYSGKTDKAGRPYILHPLRLMAKMETDDERSVALLHDVIEDSEFTAIPLREAGIPLRIVVAVQCLTKLDGESYEQFIQRVLTNELAVKVKMADIQDNLDVLRLDKLTDDDLERVRKYHAAWKVLDSH
ncbi:MAG: GTP pyrophosphokinase [Deltaproteobacteria bacterium]|nr:GTP pyrophosphokinase [Deltaproteobacteria bacterium]